VADESEEPRFIRGLVTMTVEDRDALRAEIEDLNASLKVARQVIYDQQQELQRLRRALSHS
jgi:hypothetical protein